jgi:hypothetical protein
MLKEAIKFIEKNNWNLLREGEKFQFYKPPIELGFDDEFTLAIPKINDVPDFDEIANDTIRVISEIYGVDTTEIIHDVADYFEVLKKDAIYFKLNSDNLMFQKTLEINDVWNFLKNLSTSYTNYVKIEFEKNFHPLFGADNHRIQTVLAKLVDLTRLRVVALEYQSFSVGVSADSFMGKNEIEVKEIQEWRSQVMLNYKNDIIDIDFNSIEQIDHVLKHFNDDERRKIFDPLFSSINNSSDYYITVTDKSFKPEKRLKRIPGQTVDILIPKTIEKERPIKQMGLYRTIIPIDLSKSAVKLKLSDLQANPLFTQKLDGVEIPITHLIYRDQEISLVNPINCFIKFNETSGNFGAYIADLDTTFELDSFESLEEEINEKFALFIDYYHNSNRIVDEKGQMIQKYLKSILPNTL